MSFRLKGAAALMSSESSSEANVAPLPLKASPSWLIANYLIEQPAASASHTTRAGSIMEWKRAFMAGGFLCGLHRNGKPASRALACPRFENSACEIRADVRLHHGPSARSE